MSYYLFAAAGVVLWLLAAGALALATLEALAEDGMLAAGAWGGLLLALLLATIGAALR